MPKSRDTAVGERLLDHVAKGTTDVLSDVRRIPVSYYLDPELWEQEMRNIFKRLPLMLAFSTEIAQAGAYRAIDVVGVPVLIVRGSDGVARAFLNACRHRAARLLEEGTGQCQRIVCPYHAWAYNDQGGLMGVFKSKQFGDVD
ncbi:Rieske (2Fe-2S) protein, partial [Myxococcota bacterium]|nr:Rieske (2Fe-2S) protein [Myxococcota bacterium]